MATTKVTTDVTGLNSDTTPLAWAKGTTAERPAGTISYGFLRENTTINKMEVWTNYSGTDEFKPLDDTAPTIAVDYLVVAGGGSGGGNGIGGGGGGGGYRTSIGAGNTTLDIEVGAAVSLIVGVGGAATNYPTTNPQGSIGGNSTLSTIVSTGGGGGNGASSSGWNGNGGSGGGNAYNTSGAAGGSGNAGGFTPVEGFDGGVGGTGGAYQGGGGGGASEVGNTNTQDGGTGAISTIISNTLAGTYSVGEVVGANVYFAGGGGAGNYYQYTKQGGLGGGTNGATTQPTPSSCPADAADNTGGGGGGAETDVQCGGAGGSGVVIIKTTGVASATFSAGCTVNGTAGAQTTNGDTSTGNSIFVVTVAGASDTVTFN